jgi:hypothetical protein
MVMAGKIKMIFGSDVFSRLHISFPKEISKKQLGIGLLILLLIYLHQWMILFGIVVMYFVMRKEKNVNKPNFAWMQSEQMFIDARTRAIEAHFRKRIAEEGQTEQEQHPEMFTQDALRQKYGLEIGDQKYFVQEILKMRLRSVSAVDGFVRRGENVYLAFQLPASVMASDTARIVSFLKNSQIRDPYAVDGTTTEVIQNGNMVQVVNVLPDQTPDRVAFEEIFND